MVTASNILPSNANIIQSSGSLKEHTVAVIGKLVNLTSRI